MTGIKTTILFQKNKCANALCFELEFIKFTKIPRLECYMLFSGTLSSYFVFNPNHICTALHLPRFLTRIQIHSLFLNHDYSKQFLKTPKTWEWSLASGKLVLIQPDTSLDWFCCMFIIKVEYKLCKRMSGQKVIREFVGYTSDIAQVFTAYLPVKCTDSDQTYKSQSGGGKCMLGKKKNQWMQFKISHIPLRFSDICEHPISAVMTVTIGFTGRC